VISGTKIEPKYSSVISWPLFPCFSPHRWRPEITSYTTFSSVVRLSPAVNTQPLFYTCPVPGITYPSFLQSAGCLNSCWSSWSVDFITCGNRCLLGNVLVSKQLKSETWCPFNKFSTTSWCIPSLEKWVDAVPPRVPVPSHYAPT